jgi:hypothetical protein
VTARGEGTVYVGSHAKYEGARCVDMVECDCPECYGLEPFDQARRNEVVADLGSLRLVFQAHSGLVLGGPVRLTRRGRLLVASVLAVGALLAGCTAQVWDPYTKTLDSGSVGR